jgi:hypothetical protein
LLLESLEQLNADLLHKLCDDQCPESDTLDFKRDLPGGLNEDKRELLKDVCSLANTDGGDLVYGIEEKAGAAAALKPIVGELADAAKRRISQVLDAGLEPRVQGIRVHHVDVDGGYVLVVRVPASFDGPHCIRFNNSRRFVMRNGTSTTDLTFDQLRAAFDRTATLAEQARRFIAGRLQLIIDRKTPTPLMAGPLWVVHLLPIAGLAGRKTVDLNSLYSNDFMKFIGNGWGGGSRTFNLDGLAVHPGVRQDGGYHAYNHIFRTGAIEGVRLGGARRKIDPNGPECAIVWSLEMSNFFHYSVGTFIQSVKSWGFVGPAVLSIAVLQVEGYELLIGNSYHPFSQAVSDRPHLVLPEVWIENLDTADIDSAVRPLMDMLWQAFGAERCLDFDATTGEFKPRRA